ncbi:MAG: hypothetical protein RL186_1302 [Pseudomonadota bacterium]
MTSAALLSLKSFSDTASTSHVLNLSRVHERHKNDPNYIAAPFFANATLNRAIIIKHRLRSDETYVFPASQTMATKIIFPFDSSFLASGGRSIFVGQTGFKNNMRELLGQAEDGGERDLHLLNLLDGLPCVDPFLLKEHLARAHFFPADCYFDISTADRERMASFVYQEIGDLISKAFRGHGDADDPHYIKSLVDAIMSRNSDVRLDPLRVALGLAGQAFSDGVFSWKGFIYYKWQFGQTAKSVNRVLSDLDLMHFLDRPDAAALARLDKQRIVLKMAVRTAARACTAVLSLYDDAFNDLVHKNKAGAFRNFLIEAPRLFIDLGTDMGILSHLVATWSIKFPEDKPLLIGSPAFADILSEFQALFPPAPQTQKIWSNG